MWEGKESASCGQDATCVQGRFDGHEGGCSHGQRIGACRGTKRGDIGNVTGEGFRVSHGHWRLRLPFQLKAREHDIGVRGWQPVQYCTVLLVGPPARVCMGSRAADRKFEKAKKVRFWPSSYYSRTGTRTALRPASQAGYAWDLGLQIENVKRPKRYVFGLLRIIAVPVLVPLLLYSYEYEYNFEYRMYRTVLYSYEWRPWTSSGFQKHCFWPRSTVTTPLVKIWEPPPPPPPPPPLLEDDEAGRGPDPCIFRAESTSNRQQELISKQEIHLLVAIEDSQAAAWNSRKGTGPLEPSRAPGPALKPSSNK